MANNDKLVRLEKYADNLKQRLSSQPPEKHKSNVEAWKQMLEIDLKKTLIDIKKLKE